MAIINGVFKGETQRALKDMGDDLTDLKARVEKLNQKVWVILLLLAVLMAEKFPSFIGTALAFTK